MKSKNDSGALLVASVLGSLALLLSCAGTDTSTEETPHEVPDANTVPTDATVDMEVDAGEVLRDANVDADVDAAPSTCSEGGFCWTELPAAKESLRGVWGDGQGVVWTVSAEGHVLSWDGSKWTERFTAPGPLYAIWGSSPTDIWVGGVNGLFHGTGPTSATLSWSAIAALPGRVNVPIMSIWGVNADDVWAVGGTNTYGPDEDGRPRMGKSRALHLTKSADAGAATWTLDTIASGAFFRPSNRGIQLLKVWGTASGDVWLGGKAYGGRNLNFQDSTGALLQRRATDASWTEASPVLGSGNARFIGVHAGVSVGENVWLAMTALQKVTFLETRWPTVASSEPPTDGGALAWKQTVVPEWASESNALWASSANDIWYASRYVVLHSDGVTWETVNIALASVPIDTTYWGIWGSGPDDIWIVGDGIAVHKGPRR